MTTFKVTVEDEKADSLKRLLREVPFIKSFEEEQTSVKDVESLTSHQRIKNILESAKGKNLFKDINDPSEWQRQIRKEWDRDL